MFMTSLPNGVAFVGRDGTNTYGVPAISVDVQPSDVGLASRAGWTQTTVAPWQVPKSPPVLKAVPNVDLVGSKGQGTAGAG